MGVFLRNVMSVKLKQIRNLLYLKHKYSHWPSYVTYRSFIQHMSESLQYISVANSTYGRGLFFYLVTNCPLSCIFVVVMFDDTLNSMISFLILLYVLNQFIGLFGIHILVVTLNANIHKTSKRMIHLSIHDRKFFKFSRMKLKVHNYNVAFHTSKKYGITYSSFGLISFSSFAKVSIVIECFVI